MVAITLFAAFFCGAFAVVSQSYLAREFLVVFQGNEMSLAALFGGWLGGVALGAAFGRSRLFSKTGSAYVAAVVLVAWAVLFPAALLAVRLSRLVFGVSPGAWASLWQIAGAATLLVGAFSSFAGLAFVALCRLGGLLPARPLSPGRIYASEAAGSVAGGLAFTFLLAGRISGLTAGFGCLAAASVLSAVLSLLAARSKLLARQTATTAAVGMAILAATGISILALGRDAVVDANSALRRMQTISPGFVVDSRETRYQNLTTVMLAGQYTVFGNGEALVTFPQELLEEKEAFAVLAQHPDPRRVLVVGGGPSFVASVLAYGVEHVDYIELDPAVVSVAREYLPGRAGSVADDPRVKTRFGDARAIVTADTSSRYDVAILRIGNPRSLYLNRLETREFMETVKARLSAGGVFALPVTLADGYLEGDVGRYGGTVFRTMRGVFEDVLVMPDVESLFVACTARGVLTSDVAELSRRFAARNVRSALYPAYYAAVFPPEETVSVNSALAHLSDGPLNTDLTPATYAANLRLWAVYSGSRFTAAVLGVIAPERTLWVFCAVAALFALSCIPALLRRNPAASASTAVLFTGFTAMSASVVIFYAFQVLVGYVYDWIGVLTAAFLAGIAIGGSVATRRVKSGEGLVGAETLATAAPLAVAAVVLWLFSSGQAPAHARYIVLAAALLSGFATGYEFPVAVGVLRAKNASAGDAASRMQFLDQAGACLGACVTGILLVPSLGIMWTLAVLSVVKCFSLIAVIAAGRRQPIPRQG